MAAYKGNGIIMGCKEKDDFLIASDYVDTVTENIQLFLKNKTKTLNFRLENAKADFVKFSEMVNAKENLNSALAEFDTNHNAS